MYQLLLQHKDKNDRWLSSSVYRQSEIDKNLEIIKRKEYLNRFPDDKLLYSSMLVEDIKNLEILDKIPINLIEN